MARSRQEILDDLMEQTQSDPILGSVASSLVGRELLYFGANVIYQIESFGNAISHFQDISRADMQQMIAYAYTHEVPCDTTKPATITVTLHNVPYTVYPPFSVCMTVGSTKFYNIDLVKSNQEIRLYQGNPYRSYSNSVLNAFGMDEGLLGSRKDLSSKPWSLYKEFIQGRYQSSYIKLGVNAISDSVRVFAKEVQQGSDVKDIVFPYTEFNQQFSSPDAKLYKVRTGWDRSINVYFGDENWSQAIAQDKYAYEVYWLEATTLNFTPSSQDKLYLGYDMKTVLRTKSEDSERLPYYTIGVSTSAELNSLAYARSFVQAKQIQYQGLVTTQQILNYLGTLDSVNSANVRAEGSEVNVYIKPTDVNNKAFGFVEDMLYQYGVAGTTYNVRAAVPVNFTVSLSAIDDSGTLDLARAQQIIDEFCSYVNLKISSQISSAILTQQLQIYGIHSVVVKVTVTDDVFRPDENGNMYLSATPAINTVEQKETSGELIGYDANGVWVGFNKGVINSVQICSQIGDFIYLSNQSKSWVVARESWSNGSQQRLRGVDTTKYILDSQGSSINGKVVEFTDDLDDINIARSDGKIFQFDAGYFREGPGSILHQQILLEPKLVLDINNLTADSGDFVGNNRIDLSKPIFVGRTYIYYYSADNPKLMRYNRLSREQENIKSGTEPGVNNFFVVDNFLYAVQTYNSTSNFVYNGFYVDVNTGQSFLNIGITQNSDPLGAGKNSVLLDSRKVGSFLATLSENAGTKEVSFQMGTFSVSGSNQFFIMNSINPIVFTEAQKPTRILKATPDYVYLSTNDGSKIWYIDLAGERTELNYNNAVVAASRGVISYDTGRISNPVNSPGSSFSYEVAGTIKGDDTFPNYVK